MRTPAAVQIPPSLTRRYGSSAEGRAWLASLPRLMVQRLDDWQLEPDLAAGALPWSGHGAIVIPVRRAARPGPGDAAGSGPGEAAVLKIAFPHDEALVEPQALALWNGDGAVRLLANHPDSGSLLLERQIGRAHV